MALPDLTGQNIQDSYQRVIQTDGTLTFNGTGSRLPISFDGDDVIIPGAIHAQSYIVSESYVVVTSGSTIMGDSFDDTHTFSGSVHINDKVDTGYSTITPSLFVKQDAVSRGSIANGFGGSIDFHIQRGSNANGSRTGRIASYLVAGQGGINDQWGMNLGIRNDDTQIDVLTIYPGLPDTKARVGIMNTTPSYSLDVTGDGNFTGQLNLGGNLVGDNATDLTGMSDGTFSGIVQGATGSFDYLKSHNASTTGLVVHGFISASGDISSSGTITSLSGSFTEVNAQEAHIQDFISLDANGKIKTTYLVKSDLSAAVEIEDTGIDVTGEITASGRIKVQGISASGNIIGDQIHTNGSHLKLYSNSPTDQRISGSSKIIFASSQYQFTPDNLNSMAQTAFMMVNGNTCVSGEFTASANSRFGGYTSNHAIHDHQALTIGNSDKGAKIKLFSDHTAGNRTVEMEFSASGGHQGYTIGLDRQTNTFGITPGSSMGLGPVFTVNAAGNVTASGDISSSITSTGSFGRVESTTLEATTGSFDYLMGDENSTTGLVVDGFISASGVISASADVISSTAVKVGGGGAFSELSFSNLKIGGSNIINKSASYWSIGGNIAGSLETGALRVNLPVTASGDIWVSGSGTTGGNIKLKSNGSVTASGDISSSGTVTAEHFYSSDDIVADGDISGSGDVIGSDLYTDNYIKSTAMNNTWIYFKKDGSDQKIIMKADNTQFFTAAKNGSTPHEINFNSDALDVDYTFKTDSNNPALKMIGSSGDIGMHGIGTPEANVHIGGNVLTDSHITASGNISSSGYVRGRVGHFGNAPWTTEINERYVHIHSTGSAYLRLTSTGNQNQVIEFHNNQEPDFVIGNYFNDGGFQVRSDNKTFLTIGANDGDEIEASGSLNVTSHITASGNISASGGISASNIHLPPLGRVTFQTDQYITGQNNNITIIGDDKIKLYADTAVEFRDASLETWVSIDPNAGHITASGNISSSGTIEASSFIGQRINIALASANISAPTPNKLFYGGSNGLVSNTWNVQVSYGTGITGTISPPIDVPPHYINNLHILPCGVKDVTLKSYHRIGDNGASQIPSIWIYTGSMQNDANDDITMGFAASQSILGGPGTETNGTGTHQYHIEITGSRSFTPNPGDNLIAVALLNQGTGTQAWRFNYRLDGITTE